MKRTVLATLALSTVIALAGCASGQASPASSSSRASSFSASDINDEGASSSASGSSIFSLQSSGSSESASQETPSESSASSSAAGSSDAAGTAKTISGFEALSQYPELPNGCEVTSLAAVLNYDGFDVDKGTLSDVYLPKGPVGSTDFRKAYVGNPREDEAYGCYAPVLAECANSYLSAEGSSMRATDLTGAGFRSLFDYIDEGTPVIVWGTQYCQEGYYTVTWHVDGQDLTWFRPEHCMVLVGYDLADNLVYVSDPMAGAILSYDLDLFESRYDSIFQQAIVIQ